MKKKSPSRHSVTAMFDRIAPTYDKLNKILSCGVDRYWRKALSKELSKQENSLLVDLATGTADQIISLKNHSSIKRFIGFDLSEKMLFLGQKKIEKHSLTEKVKLELGSALNIPLAANSAGYVTISFGIRNVTDPTKCLGEIYRILSPSGQALILEFSRPTSPLIRNAYLLYLRRVLPVIGKYISKDPEAYIYLNETIEEFPSGQEFLALMNAAGFVNTKIISLTLGIVNLYIGYK